MKRFLAILSSVLAALLVAGQLLRPSPACAEDKAAFLGPDGCKKCHLKQFKSWEKTAMAKTFEVLKPDQAVEKKTAAKLDPKTDFTKDDKCLKCHTTGHGDASGFPAGGKELSGEEAERAKKMEGVSCESCHGAGSLYSAKKAELEKAGQDYKLADLQKLGLTAPTTAVQCQHCHEKGGCPTMKPDYAFDFEKAKTSNKDFHDHVPLKKPH